jgi:membrane-bound lytic murein transglycosylase F
MKQFIVLTFALLVSLVPPSCSFDTKVEDEIKAEFILKDQSLNSVLERGTLVASTDYNSTNYFIYRGEPAGYQYELLKALALHLGVNLEIVVNNDLEKAFEDLWSGKVDVLAHGLTITGKRKDLVDFTIPMGQTRQVLVQRRLPTEENDHNKLIRNILDLNDKMVYVPRNSSYSERLRNLKEEIGGQIYIVDFPQDSERLIEMVSNGEIDYTVCDEHIARVNQKYYRNIDIETPVSFSQHFAWAVNVGADDLKQHINEWMEQFIPSSNGRFVYNKYFVNPRSYQSAYRYSSVKNGRISEWDDVLKEKSLAYDLDWRLIASLIYQESRFQQDAISWMGAFGLMQFMPGTAEIFGIDYDSPPEEQIEAGIKYLRKLDKQLEDIIIDDEQRLKFVLAAYNAGIAHVFDARRLAAKYNRNPNIWEDNVDYFLLNKSNPKYYNDSVVFYGYLRGKESYQYVYEILDRFEHYKNLIE